MDIMTFLNDDGIRLSAVEVECEMEEVAPPEEDLGGATARRVPHEGLERAAYPEPDFCESKRLGFTQPLWMGVLPERGVVPCLPQRPDHLGDQPP